MIDQSVVLHADHIIPRAKDGEDTMSNLVTACGECNMGKMDILLEAYQRDALGKRTFIAGADTSFEKPGFEQVENLPIC